MSHRLGNDKPMHAREPSAAPDVSTHLTAVSRAITTGTAHYSLPLR